MQSLNLQAQAGPKATRVARQMAGMGGVDLSPLDTLDDLVYGYAGILVALGGMPPDAVTSGRGHGAVSVWYRI